MVQEGEKVETRHVKVNVIDSGGRTLMPGLTDAHWHVRYAGKHLSLIMKDGKIYKNTLD